MPRYFSQAFPVVGAIIEKDGKFLLVQEHAPGEPIHGLWNQPAGWPEVGEDPIDAVKREVKEETGLEFEPTGVLGIYCAYRKSLAGKFPTGTPHAYKIIFVGRVVGGELIVPNEEISATKWWTPEEIDAAGPDVLRDKVIKKEVRDYITGRSYPLDIIHHSVS